MSKTVITRLFVGSLLALAGAVVLLLAAIGLAYANDSFIMDGSDVTGIRSTPFSWTMVGVGGFAILVMAAAALAQFVAWIGAVLNTARLEDKTWFIVLLVAGVASFGFIAMIIYVIAGPDGAPRIESQARVDTHARPAHA